MALIVFPEPREHDFKWARRSFFKIDVLAKLKILSSFGTVTQSILNLTDSVPFNI